MNSKIKQGSNTISFSRQYLKTIHSEFKKIDKTFVPAKPNLPDRKQVQINDDAI